MGHYDALSSVCHEAINLIGIYGRQHVRQISVVQTRGRFHDRVSSLGQFTICVQKTIGKDQASGFLDNVDIGSHPLFLAHRCWEFGRHVDDHYAAAPVGLNIGARPSSIPIKADSVPTRQTRHIYIYFNLRGTLENLCCPNVLTNCGLMVPLFRPR